MALSERKRRQSERAARALQEAFLNEGLGSFRSNPIDIQARAVKRVVWDARKGGVSIERSVKNYIAEFKSFVHKNVTHLKVEPMQPNDPSSDIIRDVGRVEFPDEEEEMYSRRALYRHILE